MDINSPNHRLISRKDRVKLFCKLYWRTLVIIITPVVLIPIACIGDNNAYRCFYIFLLTSVFLIADVLPACVIALIPVALITILDIFSQIHVRNNLLNCFGVILLIVAIERCQVYKRVALKLLLVFGCSHYRLSFIIFFTTMFLSIWISNTMACGLMMPLVKSILIELEKMGLIEMYSTSNISKLKSNRHEQKTPRPSEFTVFYFLGIAYSASIGGMATLLGSDTNQIFKIYCETLFVTGPKIEFPNFMLLNLPGVLLIECLLYVWMNFYFLGMFRAHSQIAMQIVMTEEEALYTQTLLTTQYSQLGKNVFHEVIIGASVILIMILQITKNSTYLGYPDFSDIYSDLQISAPSFIIVVILFIVPTDLNFLKFFKRDHGTDDHPLPQTPSRTCLTWRLVSNNVHWSVLVVIGGASALFEALKHSGMTMEFEKFLMLFTDWPAPAIVLVIIIFCKILTEFAPDSSLVYCLLPHIARLVVSQLPEPAFGTATGAGIWDSCWSQHLGQLSESVQSRIHPHYLMMAATLSSSLPFHLVTGTPANAMVAAYGHIPPWKMMYAGIGPSIIAIVVTWFTVTIWSKAIWTDIFIYPAWADTNNFKDLSPNPENDRLWP